MKYIVAIIILIVVIVGVTYSPKEKVTQTATSATANLIETQIQTNTMQKVTIQTDKGDIEIELFSTDAPKTVENFTTLAKKNYYDGVIFHRVIKGFMIQGGDPTGTGRGGPGYTFADELNPATNSYKGGYVRGVVAMANAGPNTNGSQFFIMHADYPLPHNYTIFGRVTKGMETVDMIANSPVNVEHRPLQDIMMKKVIVQ
jgi:cyclophilin family peptidyl-prolyl cis-trans isomerase